MIRIEGLSKGYGATLVLDRVDLEVAPGEILLLLGTNGAGKSTLFRCILGIESYHGRILVDGLDPLREGKEVRRRIGYMPQADGLYAELTVVETMRFHASLRDVPQESIEHLLTEVRLDDARDLRIDEISGGMRQRLAFALALLGDPSVLLLDEPTASLDSNSRKYLAERVRELARGDKTIMVATHAEHTMLSSLGRPVTLEDGQITDAKDWAMVTVSGQPIDLEPLDRSAGGAS